ncbi:hypothetical protein [uncultured Pontibacter sp.]|uniref:hypothetical protein n=1 Tax=uncultured Pontibacter sp. TaxID=453356 RepID=UPI002634F0B3|nr:hypothetical protein [uncultured Pontibacter sp.]
MKNLFMTFAFATMAFAPAFAQVGEPEERLIGSKIGGDARNHIIQNLTPQELAKLQAQQTVGNVNSIVQDGSSNIAIIQQVGVGNVTDLTQSGNGNVYEAQVEGNDNLNLIKQNGNQNAIYQDLRTDGHVYKITQQGANNALSQSEIGTIQSVPVEITQRGQGMQISITNGRVD